MTLNRRPFNYDPPLIPFLDILYEDSDIMVVNKPATILSVPGKLKQHHDSILARVKSIYPEAFAVHRLDYGTSGVLVVGLNKPAISNLGKQFISRAVSKVYVAWVDGKLEGTGAVDLPLILDLENRPFQKVDFTVGKPALTYYQALSYDAARDCTLVRLYPQTGRSHQLRVHMQQLGHSILGDHLYADDRVYSAVPHLNLHAALLRFKHPTTDEWMQFCAPAPFAVPLEHAPALSWLDEDLAPHIERTLTTVLKPTFADVAPDAVPDATSSAAAPDAVSSAAAPDAVTSAAAPDPVSSAAAPDTAPETESPADANK